MQTTHQIDYYKDGLGTRVALNTDNIQEKIDQNIRTGQYDDGMVWYIEKLLGLKLYLKVKSIS